MASVLILGIFCVFPMLAQTTATSEATTIPCTNAEASQTAGKWARQGKDDLAEADRTFPKEQYKAVLAKAQPVVELIKAANPNLTGLDARTHRGIRGNSNSPDGALPFRVTTGYFGYYCVPLDYRADIRGKVLLGAETDTWIDIHFNSFGNLLGSGLGTILAEAGKDLAQFPKSAGQIQGFEMFELKQVGNKKQEMIVIALPNLPPYQPLSREEYLQVRLKKNKDQFGRETVLSESEKGSLISALEKMSPAERQSPAVVRDFSALPGKAQLFATEAEGGNRLVKIGQSSFDPKSPRPTIQFMVVSLRWNEKDPVKAELIRQFKQNFDFKALQQMLGK